MQEPLTDLRPGPEGGPQQDDEAFQQVREKVQALITAARALSDTCADLADALRPVPGHAPDDPLVAAFGRLRAERTAALLDEAASAAQGTLGLLHSAYGALDRRPGPPSPRSGATTWPDAFVEVPARAFTVEDEVGTALGVRSPWGPLPGTVAGEGGLRSDVTDVPVDEDDTDGLRAFADGPGPADGADPGRTEDDAPTPVEDGPAPAADEPATELGMTALPQRATEPEPTGPSAHIEPGATEPVDPDATGPVAGFGTAGQSAAAESETTGPAGAGETVDLAPAEAEEPPGDGPRVEVAEFRSGGLEERTEGDLDAAGFGPEDVDGEGLRSWATVSVPVRSQSPAMPADEPERPDGTSVEDTDADDPARITSAALAGWIVVDPDDVDDLGRPIRADAETPGTPVYAATTTLDRLDVPIDDTRPELTTEPALDDPTPPDLRPAEPAPDDPAEPGPAIDRASADPGSAEPEMDDPAEPRPAADPAQADLGFPEPGLGPSLDPAPADDRHGADPADADDRHATDPADAAPDLRTLDPMPGFGPAGPGGDPFGVPGPREPVGRFGADAGPEQAPPDDGPGWHGDTVSPEPRSLSLVPPVPEGPDTIPPTWPDDRTPADPWVPRPADPWQDDPMGGADLSGAATFARLQRPMWAAEPVPGSSAAGDGVAVFPIGAPTAAPEPTPAEPLDEPAAAVIARQVEGARRHLQAALVVANGPGAPQRLGALLTAVEQVLTAVTDLARETRGLLESGLADRTFPGEARFLCCPPWDGTQLVGRDAYGDDVASPAGLAKLLRALGYEAHSITSAGGVAGVQVRGDRYAMQIALVEPAGGGRQRWSGALEWADATGTGRTWAETLGPVELEDEELARRVDELLRRSLGG